MRARTLAIGAFAASLLLATALLLRRDDEAPPANASDEPEQVRDEHAVAPTASGDANTRERAPKPGPAAPSPLPAPVNLPVVDAAPFAAAGLPRDRAEDLATCLAQAKGMQQLARGRAPTLDSLQNDLLLAVQGELAERMRDGRVAVQQGDWVRANEWVHGTFEFGTDGALALRVHGRSGWILLTIPPTVGPPAAWQRLRDLLATATPPQADDARSGRRSRR